MHTEFRRLLVLLWNTTIELLPNCTYTEIFMSIVYYSLCFCYWHPTDHHSKRVLAGSPVRGDRWPALHISGSILLDDFRWWERTLSCVAFYLQRPHLPWDYGAMRDISSRLVSYSFVPSHELPPSSLKILQSTSSFKFRLAAAFLACLRTFGVQASQS